MAKGKKKVYTGIVDCHGLESIVEAGGSDFPYSLRAAANRQRHAMVYSVELTDYDRVVVETYIQGGDFKGALTFLKTRDTFGVEESMLRSASMIPNDELDPYWSPAGA